MGNSIMKSYFTTNFVGNIQSFMVYFVFNSLVKQNYLSKTANWSKNIGENRIFGDIKEERL